MMKVVSIQIFKVLSLALSFFFRLSRPVFNITKRLIYLSKAQSHVDFSIPISSQFDGELHMIGTGKVTWGEHCRFGKDVVLETQNDGVIELGDNVRINQGSILVAHNKVAIGNDCLIGEYCSIRDANHDFVLGEAIRTQPHSYAPISVGADSWIGRGAVVLKGVTLHKGCIVGANSVVTKSVLENTVVAGITAKEIKKRTK